VGSGSATAPPSRLNGARGRSIPCDRLKPVNEIFDVAVVGAGPAGSVAAYMAATRGLRVALIDRQAFPRDKPCGDGIGSALSILHESLDWTIFSATTSRFIRQE